MGERSSFVRINSETDVVLRVLLGAGQALDEVVVESLVMLANVTIQIVRIIARNLVNIEQARGMVLTRVAHFVLKLDLAQLIRVKQRVKTMVAQFEVRFLIKDLELGSAEIYLV